jgi:hypothetical protein
MGKDKTHVNVVGVYLKIVSYRVLILIIRSHRTRRFRQVHYHWSLDLQVRWYRQAYHREVREGGC